MTERFEKLEAELASMHPRDIREEVVDEIGSALESPRRSPRWGDRCLVGAMSIGSLAACVIVAMIIVQNPGSSPASAPLVKASVSTRMGDASLAVARGFGMG